MFPIVPEYVFTEHDAALCQIVRTYGNLADVTGKYPDALDAYLSADCRCQHMPGLRERAVLFLDEMLTLEYRVREVLNNPSVNFYVFLLH